jgi:CubicO group peptidase (beta-lactamase class C family)
LPRTSPEAEGIPSSAILDFVHAVEQHTHPLDALHGFMLLRHGNVAAEGWWAPYASGCPHTLYSLSKSFTSSAVGLAVDEGLLAVDDPVLKFFAGDAPANPDENLMAMRVRHLLAMNTGHQEDTTQRVFWGADDNWPRAFLSLPVEHRPGSWFVYNTAATYMLSAIITQVTGQPLLEYLRTRLFEPLGIEEPVWETDPCGVSLGGTGLHITLDEIARFGQMYLQGGTWNGRRILPEAWVGEATSVHSDNSNTQATADWSAGYGYQFWRCRPTGYRGDGAFGQFCVVLPEQEAVLALIGGVRDMQVVLDKVWAHLLPAMQPQALPASPQAYADLQRKLAGLSLPPAQGLPSSSGAQHSSGKTYKLERNDLNLESVAVEFGPEYSTLTVRGEDGEHRLQAGYATWWKGTANLRGKGEEPVAASGAWTAPDTCEVRVCCYESEFCPTFRLHYAGDELQLQVEPNVAWDEPTVTTIAGRAAALEGAA